MKVLIEYSYDWYEWERALVVSENEELLRKYADGHRYPFAPTEGSHEYFKDKEETHLFIEDIKYLVDQEEGQ